MQLVTLKRRADFLRLRGGARWANACFALEARPRAQLLQDGTGETGETATGARFGFTVTKKLGNAVVRNRIKRRLREAVRLSASPYSQPDYDYVLIAREAALKRRFADLQSDVQVALQRVHAKGGAKGGSTPSTSGKNQSAASSNTGSGSKVQDAAPNAVRLKPRTPASD